MGDFRSRIRFLLFVGALLGVALVTLVSDRRALLQGRRELPAWLGGILDLTVPVQKAVAFPAELVRDAWRHYLDLVGVQAENLALRRRLVELQDDNLQLREALVASGRLERIAKMREQYEIPMLPAELVGVDVSPWFRSILVDKGRGQGVRSGMPVISDRALAGLVTATSEDAARGMLLLDRQSAVDGTVQRSRARGVVRGLGGDQLEFEFVARGSDVRVGDVVITSGLDGVYPKGLLIGQISEVPDSGSQLLVTALVEPAADFRRLEQVFVMLHRGPTMDLLYEGESGESVAARERPRP
jgi:rod shape-determining protein MreC